VVCVGCVCLFFGGPPPPPPPPRAPKGSRESRRYYSHKSPVVRFSSCAWFVCRLGAERGFQDKQPFWSHNLCISTDPKSISRRVISEDSVLLCTAAIVVTVCFLLSGWRWSPGNHHPARVQQQLVRERERDRQGFCWQARMWPISISDAWALFSMPLLPGPI
jgi:hypothetical protein